MPDAAAHSRGIIMLVEDDQRISQIISECLRMSGCEVVTACHGRDALDKLRAATVLPRGIILDLMMPVMDGWQFRAAQRSDPRLAAIPVVLLSAHVDLSEVAAQLGAVHWMNKPVPLKTLLAAVDSLLG